MRRSMKGRFSLLAYSLILASFLSGIEIYFLGYSVRPEHLAAIVICPLSFLYRLLRKRKPIRVPLSGWMLFGWVATGFAASIWNSPAPEESLRHVGRFGLLLFIFLTVHTALSESSNTWRTVFHLWIFAGWLEATFGSIAWLLSLLLDHIPYGVQVQPHKLVPAATGTLIEPNVFGSTAASFLVMSLFLSLARSRIRGPKKNAWIFLRIFPITFAIAVVGSQTRAAWVAAILGLMIAYPFSSIRARNFWSRAIIGLFLAVLLGVTTIPLILQLAERVAIIARVRTFLELGKDPTWLARMTEATLAMKDWLLHPFIGNGYNSFGLLHGLIRGKRAWVGNLLIHLLIDTGALGALLFLGATALCGIRAFRAWPGKDFIAERMMLRATALGLLVILVSYQATEATWMAQYWIHLAILSSGIHMILRNRKANRRIQTFVRKSDGTSMMNEKG